MPLQKKMSSRVLQEKLTIETVSKACKKVEPGAVSGTFAIKDTKNSDALRLH
jgi:hypothetical protein